MSLTYFTGSLAALVAMPIEGEDFTWGISIFFFALFLAAFFWYKFGEPRGAGDRREKGKGVGQSENEFSDDYSETYIAYKNRFNEVKPYRLLISSTTGDKIAAVDIDAGFEKTFNKDEILGTFDTYEAADGFACEKQKLYTINYPKKRGKNYGNPESRPELVFTGFSKADKELLISLAERSGFMVRKNVVKSLAALVCGPTPGPKKMELATKYNIPLVKGKDAALTLLATGELVDRL